MTGICNQSALTPKCIHGHDAEMFCTKKTCTQPSPICLVSECEYAKKHQRCTFTYVTNTVVLFSERTQLFSTLNQQVIKGFDSIIKTINSQKQKYLNAIIDPMVYLKQEEQILFKLMKEGPSKDITPRLVNRVIKSLEDDTQTKEMIEKNKRQALQIYKRFKEKVNKSLAQIDKLWNNINKKDQPSQINTENYQKTVQNPIVDFISPKKNGLNRQDQQAFSQPKNRKSRIATRNDKKLQQKIEEWKFSKEMTQKNIKVQNDGRTIKNTCSRQGFGLLSPEVRGKKGITLMIERNNGGICLGLCRRKQFGEESFPKNYKNVYMINGQSGRVKNINDLDQNEKQFQFGFQTNDLVEMEYDCSKQSLRLRNIENGTCHTMSKIKQMGGYPLNFCVLLRDKEDEVRVIS